MIYLGIMAASLTESSVMMEGMTYPLHHYRTYLPLLRCSMCIWTP